MSTILQQIAAGDPGAVSRCLETYGGLVWTIASRYLAGDRPEIEDAVQDVFVTLWRSAARFDPALGTELSFVGTIARRRVLDARRRLCTRRPELFGAGDESSLTVWAPEPPSSEEVARLGEEFAKLPEDERLALWFAVSRGLSHREIAQATSVPIGTVKSRLRRAVLRLQRALGADGRPVTHGAGEGRR